MIPPFEIDGNGYPTEEWLSAFECCELDSFKEAASFLVNDLPRIAEQIGYCTCRVTDCTTVLREPAKVVEFSTGGWSGAEELIVVMLKKLPINYMYTKWERGGRHTFEVPIAWLDQDNEE